MAYATNELNSSSPGKGSSLRAFPIEGGVSTKSFASGSTTLAPLTALAFNTSLNSWVVFDADGANGTNDIKGFVWPDEVVLDGSNEVMGKVLMAGTIHLDDIPLVSGLYNLAELKADLIANARALGFNIQGLAEFR